MPKFFVANSQIIDNNIRIIGEDVNHISNVLRMKTNDEIIVCDKDRNITYNTEILEISKKYILCKIQDEVKNEVESNIKVTIFQGLPKSDKMELIIQKTTELGVKEIVPVSMKRCIVKLEGKDESKKIERWKKIAEVAAKQSGRNMIPEVKRIINIKDIQNMVSDFDLILVAYEEERNVTLKNILKKLKEEKNKKDLKIGVVIGPEGGIDEEEIIDLKESGAKVITLGNRILRTETAPLTVLSNIMYEFEM